jgi:hypothetical protein
MECALTRIAYRIVELPFLPYGKSCHVSAHAANSGAQHFTSQISKVELQSRNIQ